MTEKFTDRIIPLDLAPKPNSTDPEVCITGNVVACVRTMTKVQAKLANPGLDSKVVVKNQLRSRYASLGAILSDARPILAEHGVLLTQPIVQKPTGVGAYTHLIGVDEESGEPWRMSSGCVFPHAHQPSEQSSGSSQTYARRYTLLAVLGLAAHDDDDDGQKATDERRDNGRKERTKEARKDVPGVDADASIAAFAKFEIGEHVLVALCGGRPLGRANEQDRQNLLAFHKDLRAGGDPGDLLSGDALLAFQDGSGWKAKKEAFEAAERGREAAAKDKAKADDFLETEEDDPGGPPEQERPYDDPSTGEALFPSDGKGGGGDPEG